MCCAMCALIGALSCVVSCVLVYVCSHVYAARCSCMCAPWHCLESLAFYLWDINAKGVGQGGTKKASQVRVSVTATPQISFGRNVALRTIWSTISATHVKIVCGSHTASSNRLSSLSLNEFLFFCVADPAHIQVLHSSGSASPRNCDCQLRRRRPRKMQEISDKYARNNATNPVHILKTRNMVTLLVRKLVTEVVSKNCTKNRRVVNHRWLTSNLISCQYLTKPVWWKFTRIICFL